MDNNRAPQGDNNKNVSSTIAQKMMECCDYVYLVSDNVRYIEDFFQENKIAT